MNVSNKSVLIAHAFFLKNDSKQFEDKFKPYPPLAALYGASVLRERGYDISLFDAVLANDLSDFDAQLSSERPSVLVIYEDDFNFLSKMCLSHVRDTTLKMLERATANDMVTIVHSSDASDNPDIYLAGGANFIVYGEGEQTLSEVIDYCFDERKTLPEKIQGTYFLKNGKTVKSTSRSTLRQLDELPQPAWDLIDFETYRHAWKKKHGFFSVNMVTTRGCPYKCNWCAKPIWGQQYSSHSPEYIAKQLQWLVANASPDHVWFADDIFGLKKGWIEKFAQLLKGLQIKVPFMIQSRADLIDEKVAEALKLAGCVEVWLGVESGSQGILDSMDKGIELTQIKQARELLTEFGIDVGFFIQLGYLNEDVEDIQKTREMLLALKPEKIGVSVSYPLPGTLFYQKVQDQLVKKTHWVESNDLDTVFQSTFKADFYRMLREHLHAELQADNSETSKALWAVKWETLIASAEKYRNIRPTRIRELRKKNQPSFSQKNDWDKPVDNKIEIQTL